jgi:hypothetical protein
MDTVMTLIAWTMAMSMFVGAIGGWSLFVVAWLIDLHTAGRLTLPIRRSKTHPQTSLSRHPVR